MKMTNKYNIRKISPILIVISLWLIFILWMISENKHIGITKYEIENNKIPKQFNGFKILQISDYHNGTFKKNNNQLLKKIKEIKPDIIVITGDFFDSKNTDFSLCFNLIEELIEFVPIYYVTGNHEKSINIYTELKIKMKELGVVILENENIQLIKNDSMINLIGIEDINFYKDKSSKNIEKTIKYLINENTYNVLLSHRPEIFENYVNAKIDLVLTGHTHGGQFRLPLIGGIYAPHQGFFPKYDAGKFEDKNTTMIISRGLGQSSIPLRFNNNPEIVLIELKNN